jgi:hypothetical protein
MAAILDFRSTQKIKNFVNHHPMIINGINQDSIWGIFLLVYTFRLLIVWYLHRLHVLGFFFFPLVHCGQKHAAHNVHVAAPGV